MDLSKQILKSKPTIIRLEQVEKIYGSGNTIVYALDQVDSNDPEWRILLNYGCIRFR